MSVLYGREILRTKYKEEEFASCFSLEDKTTVNSV